VKMRRCEDEKMWRWEDEEKMWGWEDVKMRRCEDEKMWRWEDVKMRRCEDEKVFYRPPLLEEPCAQTLSGKNAKSPYLSAFKKGIEHLIKSLNVGFPDAKGSRSALKKKGSKRSFLPVLWGPSKTPSHIEMATCQVMFQHLWPANMSLWRTSLQWLLLNEISDFSARKYMLSYFVLLNGLDWRMDHPLGMYFEDPCVSVCTYSVGGSDFLCYLKQCQKVGKFADIMLKGLATTCQYRWFSPKCLSVVGRCFIWRAGSICWWYDAAWSSLWNVDECSIM